MRLIAILFLVFYSNILLGQVVEESDDCITARLFSKMVFRDYGSGWAYVDLKKYFLPEVIKKEKVAEFKFSISHEELKWKKEDENKEACSTLTFKFDENGLVNEITIERIPSLGEFHQLYYENSLLVFAEKVMNRRYFEDGKEVSKREVEERIRQYFNERNLITKIEHLSNEDKADSIGMHFNYSYDKQDRLIQYEWASSNENSNIWKTEYLEGTPNARDTLFINGVAEGIVNKTFDESQNLIFHESISDYGVNKTNYQYNDSNQLIQYKIKDDKELDSTWDYEYDNNGFLKGITMYFDKFRVLIQRI